MRLTIQVLASALLVAVVIWAMFRMKTRGEAYERFGPPLALASAWLGLAALLLTAMLWVLPYPDRWIVLVFLLLDPLSVATGVMVLWIHRQAEHPLEEVQMQKLQARVGITLGVVAVALGYVYVMTHKTPFTPVGL